MSGIKATPAQVLALAKQLIAEGQDLSPGITRELVRQIEAAHANLCAGGKCAECTRAVELDQAAARLERESAWKPSETHPLVTPPPEPLEVQGHLPDCMCAGPHCWCAR